MIRTLISSLLLLLACIALTSPAQAQDVTRHCFNGYGYALGSGELRYIEHHTQFLVNGDPVKWRVKYHDPQGNVIATKVMHFRDSNTVPVYTFKIPADDYVEGINHNGAWTMFVRDGKNAARETETFEINMPMAADSGFHPLVQKKFDKLMAGKTVEFNFAVAGNLSVYEMLAEKINTTTFEGEKAVVFRVKLDAFLVDWFVDPLLLTYDPETERLLEYRGIGNVHDAQGEVYPVRVSYYTQMPPAARGSGVPTGCVKNGSDSTSGLMDKSAN